MQIFLYPLTSFFDGEIGSVGSGTFHADVFHEETRLELVQIPGSKDELSVIVGDFLQLRAIVLKVFSEK